MPKTLAPRRLSRDQLVGKILETAIHLFATRGYEATTMQDVAREVGLTAPALYYYFDSKQRLLFEVIELNLERFATVVDSVLATGSTEPTEQLRAFVRAHLDFQLAGLDRARIYNAMFLGTDALLDALTPRQRTQILELQTQVRLRLKAIIERGVRESGFAVDDVTATAMAILAMGEFAAAWFAPSGRLTASALAGCYAELAVRMVRPAKPNADELLASLPRSSRKR